MSGPLELLAELHEYAESAAAARLQQMHGHLTTHPKISGYDGTAAQVHQHYAQALAPIVAALRAQAEADTQVQAERDSLLSGLREAVQAWTQKRDSNRRDGDRRAEIIYGAVVSRALDILNDQETDEPAQAEAGAGQQDESTPADALEAAYERFSDKFLVRYPFVKEDQHFMVPHDAAGVFTQAMEQGVAAFRAALAQADAGGEAQ